MGALKKSNSPKISKEVQFFKLLRNLAEDLWKVRKGKEKITEEFITDFTKCFEKVAQALPLLDREFSMSASGLVFEICTELTLLLLDKTYLPVFARLIFAFSKNAKNTNSQFCILKLLSFIDYQADGTESVTKNSQKEALALVKLPKDKEKRRIASEACISAIKSTINASFGCAKPTPSSVMIKQFMAKVDPEYHNKAPKMMIRQ